MNASSSAAWTVAAIGVLIPVAFAVFIRLKLSHGRGNADFVRTINDFLADLHKRIGQVQK